MLELKAPSDAKLDRQLEEEGGKGVQKYSGRGRWIDSGHPHPGVSDPAVPVKLVGDGRLSGRVQTLKEVVWHVWV